MPIVRKQVLDLDPLYRLLKVHGFTPRWSGGDDGVASEGLVVGNNYVSICNTDELFVQGTEEFAKFVQQNWKPFNEELVINLYPPVPRRPRKLRWYQHLLEYLNQPAEGIS